MSTLKVNDIIEATAGGGTFALPRAWVNFNGVAPSSIRDSFNVASVTDLGVGRYRVNFSTSFANPSYAAVSTAGSDITDYPTQSNTQDHTSFNGATTTGNVPVFSVDQDDGEQDDADYMYVICCGDQ